MRVNLLLVGLLLFLAAIAAVAYFWNANTFYTEAYRPVVQESLERQRILKEAKEAEQREGGTDSSRDDNEPHPYGLRERDIEKHRGNRYSTF
jgi:hypothetical protein